MGAARVFGFLKGYQLIVRARRQRRIDLVSSEKRIVSLAMGVQGRSRALDWRRMHQADSENRYVITVCGREALETTKDR